MKSALILLALALVGCGNPKPETLQGYVEGEYVYVASPRAGALEALSVQRGTQVRAGEPLFALEPQPEQAAHEESERRVAQARAQLEDARKGRRSPEIEAIQEQRKQAQTSAVLSEKNFVRQQELFRSGASAANELDVARATREQNQHRVAQLTADLEAAHLGSRDDQLAAAMANVRALEAALARAAWDLEEKRQLAPQSGLIIDTLYQSGEWIAAGRPVVSLLPPANIKVRAFVPETRIGRIQLGETARVVVDGAREPLIGKVSFISPQAEYTPPVIYSRESRDKLVFMIELRFEAAVAEKLHPGQPVDVLLRATNG